MKLFSVTLLLFFGLIVQASDWPELNITYGFDFDEACSRSNNYKIESVVVSELLQKLPEIQKTWKKQSEKVFPALFHLTDRIHNFTGTRVTLTLCNLPSMSNPFLVNARWFMHSYTPETRAAPLYGMMSTVLHEYLHNYLDDIFPYHQSKLFRKYRQKEDLRTCMHLHLLAIEVMLAKTLESPRVLHWLEYLYTNLGESYINAWKIVNEIERPQAFIDEIRILSKK